jgi:hypothetical protein
MSAPKGNQFWKARSSSGRHPIYANAEDLANACNEYFEFADRSPIISYKPILNRDGAIEQMETIHQRPYTIEGLCRFIGLTQDSFKNYESKGDDFLGVCKDVRECIRDQKLSGAMVGIFNHNIVARDLQLRDSSSVTVEAPQGIVFNMNYGGKSE